MQGSSYRWSKLLISVPANKGALIKNTGTGAIVFLSHDQYLLIETWLRGEDPTKQTEEIVSALLGNNDILVEASRKEEEECIERFLSARESGNTLTVHLLPTLLCQLHCPYCFEKDLPNKKSMGKEVLTRISPWLRDYFLTNKECTELRFVLFGGEPLLRMDLLKRALETVWKELPISKDHARTEIITNGELLTRKVLEELDLYNVKRIQITIDGPQEVHDKRRHGTRNRGTFTSIMKNIQQILEKNITTSVDLRLTLDSDNAHAIPRLLHYLSDRGWAERIDLSIGLTSATLEQSELRMSEEIATEQILTVWRIAQSLGFAIPEEYAVGPLCIATIPHSVVIEPNGSLQKCFCLVGRSEYSFGNMQTFSKIRSLRDTRFELFQMRTKKCRQEECSLLPLCGGGCVYYSLTAQTDFGERFCEKNLIRCVNEGLLLLNYEKLVN